MGRDAVRRRGRLRDPPDEPGRERLDAYTRSLVEHTTETTERDISWLDRLIAAERSSVRRGDRPAARRHKQTAETEDNDR